MMAIVTTRQELTVRRLSNRDLPAIRELNVAHGDVMRHPKPVRYDQDFERSLQTTYLAEGNGVIFGAFVEDRLDAYLSVYLWRAFPYFSIGNLKTRPGHVNLFASGANPLAACTDAALAFTEAKGAFRGYMVRALQRWPAQRVRRNLTRAGARVGDYHYEVELIVPRNTRPHYSFAWSLMGERLWAQDLAVETLTLKQEKRPGVGTPELVQDVRDNHRHLEGEIMAHSMIRVPSALTDHHMRRTST